MIKKRPSGLAGAGRSSDRGGLSIAVNSKLENTHLHVHFLFAGFDGFVIVDRNQADLLVHACQRSTRQDTPAQTERTVRAAGDKDNEVIDHSEKDSDGRHFLLSIC